MYANKQQKNKQSRVSERSNNFSKCNYNLCLQKVGSKYLLIIDIAGSGNKRINSYRNSEVTMFGYSDDKIANGPSYGKVLKGKDDDGYKYKIDVQGPAGIANAGIFDSGTNSIENIAKTLSNQVQQILNMNPANTITVRVRGHSRGGVALSFFLREISKQYKSKVSVDYSIQYDPVPGQTISTENMDYSKIGSSKYYRYDVDRTLVKKSIVVYSLYTQYGYEQFGTTVNSFVPQAVFGTDIIIVECKNHSVGLNKGKEFIDTQLGRGVYIRRHYQLEKVNSYEEFKRHSAILEYPFKQANKNNPKNEEIEKRVNYQQKRYNVIYDVVKAWFKKNN